MYCRYAPQNVQKSFTPTSAGTASTQSWQLCSLYHNREIVKMLLLLCLRKSQKQCVAFWPDGEQTRSWIRVWEQKCSLDSSEYNNCAGELNSEWCWCLSWYCLFSLHITGTYRKDVMQVEMRTKIVNSGASLALQHWSHKPRVRFTVLKLPIKSNALGWLIGKTSTEDLVIFWDTSPGSKTVNNSQSKFLLLVSICGKVFLSPCHLFADKLSSWYWWTFLHITKRRSTTEKSWCLPTNSQ